MPARLPPRLSSLRQWNQSLGTASIKFSTTKKNYSTSTSSSPINPPSTKTKSSYPPWSSFALFVAGISAGIGSTWFLPRPKLLNLLYPLPTPTPPQPETPEGKAWTKKIEDDMQSLAIVKSLRAAVDPLVLPTTSPAGSTLITTSSISQKQYKESRPYATSIPGPHSLSAYTLRGPGKFAVPPLVFTNQAKTESIFIMHLGGSLCGHEGVVHGGLLATILDEALGRTAFLGLPSNIGVTATLNMNYRKPTFADQYVVLRTSLLSVDGRKAYVKGHIEDLDGVILAEATALFVEPRMAKFLDNSSVREAMG